MSDKKSIDRLFQEKLKNFEASPSDAVWENIQNKLQKDKRKRRIIIPIWWRVAGVAAIIVLLFTVGNSVFNSSEENTTNPIIVDTNSKTQDGTNLDQNSIIQSQNTDNNSVVKDDSNSQENINKNSTSPSNDEDVILEKITKTKSSIANTRSFEKTKSSKDAVAKNDKKEQYQKNKNAVTVPKKENTVVSNSSNLPEPNLNSPENKIEEEIDTLVKDSNGQTQNALANNESPVEENNTTETESKEPTIEDAIAMVNDNNEEEEEKEKLNRWNISPNVAPVYFNSLGKGSSIDGQFVNNTKEGDVNMSYGLGGSYAINKKLKIRAGINKVELGYDTNNVIAYDGVNTRNSETANIKYNDSTTIFLSAESFDFATSPELLNTNIKGSLEQRLGFIEVPLEVEYNLVDKKIGVNVIGGFSTLFLTKNEIYSNLEGNRTQIGEATNINSMSYSANVGLGVNYNVSEKIKVNLEPMFKYQINTFNKSSGDFKPYFIGVYTGLSYKF